MRNEASPVHPKDEVVDDDTVIALGSLPNDQRDDDCDCAEED
jgi:hypothetical protein